MSGTLLLCHKSKYSTTHWYIIAPPFSENLEVTIPKDLVASLIGVGNGNKDLEIKLLENRMQATIYFTKETRHLKDGFSLEDMIIPKGYQLMEKNSCNIESFPCVWIKARRKLKEINYLEDIFFPSKNFFISLFLGIFIRENTC